MFEGGQHSTDKNAPAAAAAPHPYFLQIAVPAPMDQTFTYLSAQKIPVGCRVFVPFGKTRTVGVCLGAHLEAPELPLGIKPRAILGAIDSQPVFTEATLTLARWLNQYYRCPIGEVLRTMLPAGKVAMVQHIVVAPCPQEGDREIAELWGRVKALFKKKESLSEDALNRRLEAHLLPFSIDTLVKRKIVARIRRPVERREKNHEKKETDLATRPSRQTGELNGRAAHERVEREAQPFPESAKTLTDEQMSAFAAMQAPENQGKPFLLHGITGSGKTEIYLQMIRGALDRDPDAQALVLVPEISLTPQMTDVFTRRFPGHVAVVHSGVRDAERRQALADMRMGTKRILIGARSAIFAAFQRLAVVIVDEEHDTSYKQSTGLTYNARDVAVVRGKQEQVAVILGSATPSLDSYLNARSGRYHYLRLHKRAVARSLPRVELVAPPEEEFSGTAISLSSATGRVETGQEHDAVPIAPLVCERLQENLDAGYQAMVLVNRRGHAYYLYALSKRQPIVCPNCSISMTLHRRSTVLSCHYCDRTMRVADVLKGHPGERFVAVGFGSEKVEIYLQQKLPKARIARLDSDTSSDRGYLETTLRDFREGRLDILVGTQILAKGHDFPNVTLLVMLDVDKTLALPDFRAGERTFQLLVQASGRAGRAHLEGNVLVQCRGSEHPIIEAGLRADYDAFAERELEFRKRHGYPPFTRLVEVEFSSEDVKALVATTGRVERWIENLARIEPRKMARVSILGPAPPALELLRKRHRRTLLLLSEEAKSVRWAAAALQLAFRNLPSGVRMQFDFDPQSVM